MSEVRFDSTKHAPAIQRALLENGFNLTPNGIWDEETRNAYKVAAGKYYNTDYVVTELPVLLSQVPKQLHKYIDDEGNVVD